MPFVLIDSKVWNLRILKNSPVNRMTLATWWPKKQIVIFRVLSVH